MGLLVSKKSFDESVAKSVRKAIESKPSVVDCLKADVVNYSALARLLCKELAIENEEAVVSAIKRHKESLEPFRHDKRVRRLVAESTIELKPDVAIITVPKEFDWRALHQKFRVHHVVEGPSYTTVVVDERSLGNATTVPGGEVRSGLAAITVKSTPEFVSTPGSMVHFISPISFNGINIEEVMSSYTDKIILVKLEDAARAFSCLNELINDARKELR